MMSFLISIPNTIFGRYIFIALLQSAFEASQVNEIVVYRKDRNYNKQAIHFLYIKICARKCLGN